MQAVKSGQKGVMSAPSVKMVNTDKKWTGFKLTPLSKGKR